MKLSTKILTALLPAVVLGTTVPATVSCSCGGNSYVINYGDDVNCKDEKAENYHSLDDVKNAVKSKALKEPAGQITSDTLEGVNDEIYKEENVQVTYYDIIASRVFVEQNPEFTLSNWKFDKDNLHITFALDGVSCDLFQDPTSPYSYSPEKKCVVVSIREIIDSNVSILYLPSYRFSDCTFVPE